MAHIMWKRMACRFKKQDNRVDISELITALVQHMTDFCQTISMSINSPLRFTPLSKSYWFFFTRHYGCSSRGSLCRICNVFARRVRIGGLLLLAKGNRGGGCFSATAIGKVHWTFPSPLNTLNIGSNKRNVTNLSDWISNQVYRL